MLKVRAFFGEKNLQIDQFQMIISGVHYLKLYWKHWDYAGLQGCWNSCIWNIVGFCKSFLWRWFEIELKIYVSSDHVCCIFFFFNLHRQYAITGTLLTTKLLGICLDIFHDSRLIFKILALRKIL